MQDPFVLSDFSVLSTRVTECCCRDSLSTETNKRRRADLERDTASSGGMLPPLLAEDNDRRGSGVGSVGANFPPPLRVNHGVLSLDHTGMLLGSSCLLSSN